MLGQPLIDPATGRVAMTATAPTAASGFRGLTLQAPRVYVSTTGGVTHYSQGLPMDAAGQLSVADGTLAPDHVANGMPYTLKSLAIDTVSAIDHYANGMPFTAAGRIAALLGDAPPVGDNLLTVGGGDQPTLFGTLQATSFGGETVNQVSADTNGNIVVATVGNVQVSGATTMTVAFEGDTNGPYTLTWNGFEYAAFDINAYQFLLGVQGGAGSVNVTLTF